MAVPVAVVSGSMERHGSGSQAACAVAMPAPASAAATPHHRSDLRDPVVAWTAAAHAVVLAAGGQIVTLDGEPLRYNLKDSLLNPPFLVIADAGRDWVGLFRSNPEAGA